MSAAEGNLRVVRVLVEEAGACLRVKDRWDFTLLDEAMRVGAGPGVRWGLGRGLGSGVAGSGGGGVDDGVG